MNAVTQIIKYANQQVDRIHEASCQVADAGDVAAVHALRVASRRVREPLEVMTPWLPKTETRKVLRKMRRLRRDLRAVRDLDVLLAALTKAGTAPNLTAEHSAHLEGLLTAARQKAHQRAVAKGLVLRADEAVGRARRLLELCEREPADPLDLQAHLGKIWRKRVRRVLALAPVGDANFDLHALRLRIKALRYCTELLEKTEPNAASSLVKQLVEMQDVLGAWSDHIGAARMLCDLARDPQQLACDARWSAEVLRCAASRADGAGEGRRALPQRWESLTTLLKSIPLDTGRAEPSPAPVEG